MESVGEELLNPVGSYYRQARTDQFHWGNGRPLEGLRFNLHLYHYITNNNTCKIFSYNHQSLQRCDYVTFNRILYFSLENHDDLISDDTKDRENKVMWKASRKSLASTYNSSGFNIDTPDCEAATKKLLPLPGFETLTSLILRRYHMIYFGRQRHFHWSEYNGTFPTVLFDYLWPELRYLEVYVNYFNTTQVKLLKESTPKLKYLKLCMDADSIPDAVWTFDWNSLPWKTGIVAFFTYDQSTQAPFIWNLRSKITSRKIPPLLLSVYWLYKETDIMIDLDADIDFSQNGLTSLGFLSFSLNYFEIIQLSLNLSHNNLMAVDLFSRFHLDVFPYTVKGDRIPKIHILDLSHNNLGNLSCKQDFLLFTHLRELYLHHNNYMEIPHYKYDARNGANYKLKIGDLKEFIILDLSYNSIDSQLYETVVNFYGDIASELSDDHFSPRREIYFGHNHFRYTPGFVFKSKHLTYVDFSNNNISTLPVYEAQNGMRLRSKHSYHVTLNLKSNLMSNPWPDFTYISNNTLYHSGKFVTGSLIGPEFGYHNVLENFNIELDGNPINCSCVFAHRMFKYLISSSRSERINETFSKDELPDFTFYKHQWKCEQPLKWTGMPLMQIPENEYDRMCLHNPCSKPCYCHHSWNLGDVMVANCTPTKSITLTELPSVSHLNDLSVVILAGNNIKRLCDLNQVDAKMSLESLRILDLSWNNLNEICSDVLSHMINLKELNLANNSIKQLPMEIEHMKNLTTLYLGNNRLEELPNSIQNLEHLRVIDVTGNIFRCDCDTFWMTQWLLKLKRASIRSHGVICFSGYGKGKRLLDLHQEDVGCNKPLINALIGLGVAIGITLVFGVLLYRKRGHIKIWLYARFGFHPWDRVNENPEEKDYDAFVSYCRKDVDWVLDTLLPYLEAPQCGFHLCVHERDFVPGVAITKNIMTAIQCSRRTILVLSPNFIKSGWCDLEFQAAHQRALEDRSNFLIVVLLEEVDHKDLDETLSLYMKTRTYITVKDNWFWQKMLYAMPKVSIDRLKAQYAKEQLNNCDQESDSLENKDNDDVPLLDPDEDGNIAVQIEPIQHDNFPDLNQDDDDDGDDDDDDDDLLLNNITNISDAAIKRNDNISLISSSESYTTSDSETEIQRETVFHPASKHRAVAMLPPLFKRINTYTNLTIRK